MESKCTVNPGELENFEKFADKWWSPTNPYRGLLYMTSIKVPYIAGTIEKSPGVRRRILDVGCGGGFISETLGQYYHNVLQWGDEEIEIIGIDPGADSIAAARAHLPNELRGKVSYICDSIEGYIQNNPGQMVDTLVMSEVIEHVDNPREFIKYAASLVKPGGSIIFTAPAKTFINWLSLIVLAEFVLRILPIGTHEYDKLVSQEDATKMLEENNFEVKEVRGYFMNPISQSFFWSPYAAVLQYAIRAVKKN